HFRRDFYYTSWKPCQGSNPKLGGMASRCASLFIGCSSRSPVGVAPRAVRRIKSRVVAKTVGIIGAGRSPPLVAHWRDSSRHACDTSAFTPRLPAHSALARSPTLGLL